jgi:hypothetical protein
VKFTVDRKCCEIPVDAVVKAANATNTKAKARRMKARERFDFIVGMPKINMRIPEKNARLFLR